MLTITVDGAEALVLLKLVTPRETSDPLTYQRDHNSESVHRTLLVLAHFNEFHSRHIHRKDQSTSSWINASIHVAWWRATWRLPLLQTAPLVVIPRRILPSQQEY